jgi:hypothetical protein
MLIGLHDALNLFLILILLLLIDIRKVLLWLRIHDSRTTSPDIDICSRVRIELVTSRMLVIT